MMPILKKILYFFIGLIGIVLISLIAIPFFFKAVAVIPSAHQTLAWAESSAKAFLQ